MTNFFLLAKPLTTTNMVNNLRAGSQYKFKVGAMNKFGLGDLSYETDWIQTQTLGNINILSYLQRSVLNQRSCKSLILSINCKLVDLLFILLYL